MSTPSKCRARLASEQLPNAEDLRKIHVVDVDNEDFATWRAWLTQFVKGLDKKHTPLVPFKQWCPLNIICLLDSKYH